MANRLGFLALFLAVLNNGLSASPAPVVLRVLRPVIPLLSVNPREVVRVDLTIKVENNAGNRRIDLEVIPLGIEGDGVLSQREYLPEANEPEHSIISANYFWNRDGLLLSKGEYEIRAVLTRIVNGEEKKFTSVAKVTIGVPEDKG
jgi:hypothetical protein